MVISTVPVNQATGVPTNRAISAVFSEAMSPATINAATFTLAGPGGAAVTGVVTYIAAGSIATFTPAAALSPNLVYTATITTAAQDLLARGLAANYVWTFTAAAGPDLTPPTVISTIPANTAINVPTNQAVTATFSEALEPRHPHRSQLYAPRAWGSGCGRLGYLCSDRRYSDLFTPTPRLSQHPVHRDPNHHDH